MSTTSSFHPARPATALPVRSRLVVDTATRLVHALIACSFIGAYLTAESERWRALHVSLGYTLAGLLVWRLLDGFFGPPQTRLGPRWRQLGQVPAWFRGACTNFRHGHAARVDLRRGFNLMMVVVTSSLLALIVPLTLSGQATYGEWFGGEVFEELHESFGNAMLAAVVLHLSMIAGSSLLQRKNQALPMISGRIQGAGPDLVKHPRRVLAAAILVATLGFLAWQWQASPGGLLPSSRPTQPRHWRCMR